MKKVTFIGTAAWSIPRADSASFSGPGQHLARYARVLNCSEINSSFKRHHRVEVYQRWSAMTPPDFRFAVKMPAEVTHVARLEGAQHVVEQFLDASAGLGSKLGVLLAQLPPSLIFKPAIVDAFFSHLRRHHAGPVVCEPRHPSWLEPAADRLLIKHRIGRVAADPALFALFGVPDGWLGPRGDGHGAVVYCRLHGKPRVYWSDYDAEQLQFWAERIFAVPQAAQTWCIFDNTAAGRATSNALEMKALLNTLEQEQV